jgi:uncharacterized protein GlcG (DUF336 family)
VSAAQAFGVGQGDPNSGTDEPVTAGPSPKTLLDGRPVPDGWLVTPHAGGNLTAADVTQIIDQGIAQANATRAQIRLPDDQSTRMVFAVADSQGDILGLYRMPDASVFSIDVAVAKARNTAYYDDPAQLLTVDQVPGVPLGTSMTARTFRYLAQPFFPEGINGKPPGPFSALNDPGVNQTNALNVGPPLPASSYTSVYAYNMFNPNTNFHAQTDPANQNGVVFFPGSSGVYKDVSGQQAIVGGFGVSGDGVNQDDVVTASGIAGFTPPDQIRADQVILRGVRLPYQNFSRNPEDL